jgi:zinc and cadmium transporter
MVLLWAIGSTLVISLLSVVAAIPLLLKKKISQKTLMFLLSLSVGTFLGTIFLMLLPEIFEEGYTTYSAIYIFAGFLSFFVIEKIIHHNHSFKCKHPHPGHGHAYHLAPLTLIGDGLHNFVDGIAIAASYAVSIPFGIAATVAIIFHELPQEMADIGVLLHAKVSKKKAIIFNLLSALTAILGAIVGALFTIHIEGFHGIIIPFIAGVFIYIAASGLVPELHKHCTVRESVMHVLAIVLGIVLVALVAVYGPGHA